MANSMERRIREIEKDLIWEYCKEHEKKLFKWNIIGILSITIPALMLVRIFYTDSLTLIVYLAVVLSVLSLKYLQHECVKLYNEKKYTPTWHIDFVTFCTHLRTQWLYEGKISKVEYELYSLHEKKEECTIKMFRIIQEEKRMKKVAKKAPVYSIEQALEIAELPEPEKTKRLNEIILEEFRIESC